MYLKKYKNKYKSFRSDQSSVWTKKQPRMENQLPAPVLAFKDKGYLFKKISRRLSNYRRVLQSILSYQEPESNSTNKQHDASTVIRTFIVSNMIKTTRCDKSLTP